MDTRNRAAFTAAMLFAFVGLTAIVGSFPLFSGTSVAPSSPNVDSAALAGRFGTVAAVSSSIGTAEGPIASSLSCAVAGVAGTAANTQVEIEKAMKRCFRYFIALASHVAQAAVSCRSHRISVDLSFRL